MKPQGVLVCPPTFFDVVDRKNPFMDPTVRIDRTRAFEQWSAVVVAFRTSGLAIHEIAPVEGCEDMVFTANPTITGLDSSQRRRAVTSHMRFASRNGEVTPQAHALRTIGYDIVTLADGIAFEGGGDAVWHSNGKTVFLGVGPRTDAAAATILEQTYGVEVVPLSLSTERFYHLDTALSVLDAGCAIAHPGAFDDRSYAEITRRFATVIEADDGEANRMACNAARGGANVVIIDCAATGTIDALRNRGYDVAAVDTSEFMKSGGSVYCMKQYVF